MIHFISFPILFSITDVSAAVALHIKTYRGKKRRRKKTTLLGLDRNDPRLLGVKRKRRQTFRRKSRGAVICSGPEPNSPDPGSWQRSFCFFLADQRYFLRTSDAAIRCDYLYISCIFSRTHSYTYAKKI